MNTPLKTSNHLGTTIDMNISNTHYLASQESSRKKVLFFAEDATLAHVGRMITLAGSLDRGLYEVAIACGTRYRHFVESAGLRVVHAHSMSPEAFAKSLARGTPLYTSERLQKYVADDLRLIARESPDLLVGDFRISLGITAELSNVPYVAVTNGHWSPYSTLKFPLPELPAVRLLGTTLVGAALPLIQPLAFKKHASAFNKMRKSLGLPPVGSLREVYTHATWTLYPDIPSLAPTSDLPENHVYIGPILWEPEVSVPEWWNDLPADRPIIYLNVGSSGHHGIFDTVVRGLADMPVTVIAATADRDVTSRIPENVYIAPYLPGMECSSRASLVIFNGGCATGYQAIHHGVPLLGIPSNADQHFFMKSAADEGAGILIRAGKITPRDLRRGVERLLKEEIFAARARELASEIAACETPKTFAMTISNCLQNLYALEQIQ